MNLDQLRQRLTQVDRELLKLAKERQDLVGQVGAHKIAHGVPTRDYERERDVLKGARDLAESIGLDPDLAEAVLQLLIRSSLMQQEETRVAAVTAGVLIPWVAYSSIRMESTVLVSTNSGGMLQGANCRSTFYGPLLGAWDPTCGRPRAQSESELAWASEARERAPRSRGRSGSSKRRSRRTPGADCSKATRARSRRR